MSWMPAFERQSCEALLYLVNENAWRWLQRQTVILQLDTLATYFQNKLCVMFIFLTTRSTVEETVFSGHRRVSWWSAGTWSWSFDEYDMSMILYCCSEILNSTVHLKQILPLVQQSLLTYYSHWIWSTLSDAFFLPSIIIGKHMLWVILIHPVSFIISCSLQDEGWNHSQLWEVLISKV